jgi:hypothetical protein
MDQAGSNQRNVRQRCAKTLRELSIWGCNPFRKADRKSLPKFCRKPTPFFHDPSQSCTIYPIDTSIIFWAPFAAM